jgi:hypothetical protein
MACDFWHYVYLMSPLALHHLRVLMSFSDLSYTCPHSHPVWPPFWFSNTSSSAMSESYHFLWPFPGNLAACNSIPHSLFIQTSFFWRLYLSTLSKIVYTTPLLPITWHIFLDSSYHSLIYIYIYIYICISLTVFIFSASFTRCQGWVSPL